MINAVQIGNSHSSEKLFETRTLLSVCFNFPNCRNMNHIKTIFMNILTLNEHIYIYISFIIYLNFSFWKHDLHSHFLMACTKNCKNGNGTNCGQKSDQKSTLIKSAPKIPNQTRWCSLCIPVNNPYIAKNIYSTATNTEEKIRNTGKKVIQFNIKVVLHIEGHIEARNNGVNLKHNMKMILENEAAYVILKYITEVVKKSDPW